ncbi:unnamed protein product [Phaedon cochleariae]|uniref:Uncharacterized protein n=1 Tax=Phaedon cochleariae TaxID=80249 RepID=A0A9N9SJT8_PHACE|nr:unnamed protein product [Phaedon cochleariae]
MFSFHRPKVYRSSTGCCICKAKSSSSRFTDSKKYEEDFLECFKLSTRRQGEICNACVLLVKRWKKLPLGSDRNWQHVVDARAGPGIKSMTKFKAKNRKLLEEKFKSSSTSKEGEREREEGRDGSPSPSDKSDGNAEGNDDMIDLDLMMAAAEEERRHREGEGRSSRAGSPAGAASDPDDGSAGAGESKSRRYKALARHRDDIARVSDFVDLHYWKRETVCCGTVFKGLYDEIMIDPRFIKPCGGSRAAICKSQPEKIDDIAASKVYSDSSSDSGYDESSNQGPGSIEGAFKKDVEGN